MAIKNYSSMISPSKSLGEIQQLLAENRALRVQMEYDGGKPTALSFSMIVGDNELFFRLTVNVEGMLLAMKKDKKVRNNYCNYEQAERTAWKNKHEWLHIQLSEIEAGQARIEQLLLGYAVTDNGQTAFERLVSGEKLLTD